MKAIDYTGRFAPSPTGLLHFGSLLAAMASYADARSHHGRWQLRIDDIDPPRSMLGAIEQIPRTLQQYGMTWDGDVILQSSRTSAYRSALEHLNTSGRLYLCSCSRKKLRGKVIYPGYCRPPDKASHTDAQNDALNPSSEGHSLQKSSVKDKLIASDNENAVRVILQDDICFTDAIQGDQQFRISSNHGDTIVLRRDELFSYALCCAIDDANGVTHVVRGSDLLTTTPAQIGIMKHLNLQPPNYAHIPVATNINGQKLSKQTFAEPIDSMPTLPTLKQAWEFLGQTPVETTTVEAFWDRAVQHWQLKKVPCVNTISAPD